MLGSTHTLIISDTHLGCAAVSSRDLISLLSGMRYERLIILGDLFDHANLKKLKKLDWELLALLKDIADKIEVIWIKGNHDREFPHQLPELGNIRILEEYIFEYQGKKYVALHGDQFDTYLQNKSFVTGLGDGFNKLITKINAKNRLVMGTVGRLYGAGLKLSKILAKGALAYAEEKGADYIICGHTHEALIKKSIRNGKEICYLNSGSWTRSTEYYITIDKENGPQLHQYVHPAISPAPHKVFIFRRKNLHTRSARALSNLN